MIWPASSRQFQPLLGLPELGVGLVEEHERLGRANLGSARTMEREPLCEQGETFSSVTERGH